MKSKLKDVLTVICGVGSVLLLSLSIVATTMYFTDRASRIASLTTSCLDVNLTASFNTYSQVTINDEYVSKTLNLTYVNTGTSLAIITPEIKGTWRDGACGIENIHFYPSTMSDIQIKNDIVNNECGQEYSKFYQNGNICFTVPNSNVGINSTVNQDIKIVVDGNNLNTDIFNFTVGGSVRQNQNYGFTDTFSPVSLTINNNHIGTIRISQTTISPVPDQTYTGSAITPNVTITDNGYTLVKGTDYTLSYSDNVNSGTANITITGKGRYSGSANISFNITGISISSSTIGSIDSYTYDGNSKTPTPSITCNNVLLTNNTDYTLSYSNNINSGTATVTAIGKGNYIGSVSTTFTINKYNLSNSYFTIGSYTYNGNAKTPTPTVYYSSSNTGKTLTYNSDYTRSYSNNTNAGTGSLTITAVSNSNYTGSKTVNFTINKDNSSVTSNPTANSLTYSGSSQTLTTTGSCSGGTLYYRLYSYTDNSSNTTTYNNSYSTTRPTGNAAGTYVVQYYVSGDSNHNDTGVSSVTITISKASFTSSVSISNYSYAGTKSAPSVTSNPGGGTVTYYGRATSSGTATNWSSVSSTTYDAGTRYIYATIAATNNYNSYTTGNTSFTVNKGNISSSVSISNYTYGGTKSTPSVTSNPGGGTVTYYGRSTSTGSATNWSSVSSTTYDAGTRYIYAYIAETTNYNAYTTGNTSFTINKASFTASVSISNYTYGGIKSTPSVTSNPGGGTVTYYGRSTSTGSATNWSSVSSTTYNAGTRYIYAYIAETTNYNSYTTGNTSFTISKGTISASVSIANYTYAGTKSTPSVTSNPGGGAVTYYARATSSGAATNWSNVSSTTYDAGTRYIYATIAETTNYNGYTTGNTSFTINKASFTASVSISNYTWHMTKSTPTITNNPGSGAVTYYARATSSGTATNWSNVTYTTYDAGTRYIYATIAETTNYAAYTTGNTSFTVYPFDINEDSYWNDDDMYYVNNPHTPNSTYTGGSLSPTVDFSVSYINNNQIKSIPLTQNVDFTVSLPSDCVNAGTKTITVTGTGNYTGSKTCDWIINKVNQTTPTSMSYTVNSATSITISSTDKNTATNYLEYSKDGSTWYSSSTGSYTFTGLTSNTQYTFYIRKPSSTNYNVSGNKTLTASPSEYYYTWSGTTITGLTTTGKSQTTLTIPSKCTKIGSSAFANDTTVKTINGGSNVTSIGSKAFSGCTALTTYTMSDSVTSISQDIFENCSSLTNCTLSNYITILPTFKNCTSLTTLQIPKSIPVFADSGSHSAYTYKGSWPDSLVNFTVNSSNPYLSATDNVIYNKAQTTLLYYPTGKTNTQFYIPASVVTIGMYAFYNNSYISSIYNASSDNSLTTIKESAFGMCRNLTLPYFILTADNLSTIEDLAFSHCEKLKAFATSFNSNTLTLGLCVFQYCYALKEIHLNNQNVSLDDFTFYYCSNSGLTDIYFEQLTKDSISGSPWGANSTYVTVHWKDDSMFTWSGTTITGLTTAGKAATSLTVPDKCTAINSNAFSTATSLKELTIPSSVTSMPQGLLSNCTALTKLSIPYTGASKTSTGYQGLFGYIFSSSSKTGCTSTKQYYNASSCRTYYIPTSLKNVIITSDNSLPYGAFHNCSNLTRIYFADSGITSIDVKGFYGCTKLTAISIPDTVTSIGSYAFAQCTALTNIYINKTANSITGSPWGATNATITWNSGIKLYSLSDLKEFKDTKVDMDEVNTDNLAVPSPEPSEKKNNGLLRTESIGSHKNDDESIKITDSPSDEYIEDNIIDSSKETKGLDAILNDTVLPDLSSSDDNDDDGGDDNNNNTNSGNGEGGDDVPHSSDSASDEATE